MIVDVVRAVRVAAGLHALKKDDTEQAIRTRNERRIAGCSFRSTSPEGRTRILSWPTPGCIGQSFRYSRRSRKGAVNLRNGWVVKGEWVHAAPGTGP